MVKNIIGFLGVFVLFFSFFTLGANGVVNTDFPYEGVGQEAVSDSDKIDMSIIMHDDIVDEGQGYIHRLLSIFGLDQFASGTDPQSGTTTGGHNYIIYLINIGIGLSAFIALLFIVYGFAKMFFSSDEEGRSNAVKIVKNSAIAIVIIGVSWIVVSFLFYFFNTVNDVNTNDNQILQTNNIQTQ